MIYQLFMEYTHVGPVRRTSLWKKIKRIDGDKVHIHFSRMCINIRVSSRTIFGWGGVEEMSSKFTSMWYRSEILAIMLGVRRTLLEERSP